MSLDKAIEHGKEKRKAFGRQYGTFAKSVDTTCRNHGSCDWCRMDRMIKNIRREKACIYKLAETDTDYR